MMRHHRRDPEYYEELLRSGQIDSADPDGGVDADGAPWGEHPFYDYGFEERLGRGRVLWDILRPSVGRACRRAWETALFWECVEKAASTIECIRIARAQRGLVDDPLVIA